MKTVMRHSLAVRIVHWSIAVSIFLLFFSGFGQMPLYKRYLLTDVLPWTGDYWLLLHIHYGASVILVIAVTWHIVYHMMRKEFGLIPRSGDIRESWIIIKAMIKKEPEPPHDKYLAEQRLAYLYIGVVIIGLVFTGYIKVLKNMGFYFPDTLLFVTTQLHTIFTVFLLLGVFAHLAAFIIPANRQLIGSMITGKVDWEYVKKRHPIWMEKILKKSK